MRKKLTSFYFLLLAMAGNVFAGGSAGASGASAIKLDNLDKIASSILAFFTSDTMKAFFAIALAGLAVGFVLNRDNEGAKKKIIIWAVAIGVVLGAQTITDAVFSQGALIP